MAVKLNELEETGTRWQAPSEDYPQGSFINGTGKGKRDGSYAKAEWANDLFGAHAAILKTAERRRTDKLKPRITRKFTTRSKRSSRQT